MWSPYTNEDDWSHQTIQVRSSTNGTSVCNHSIETCVTYQNHTQSVYVFDGHVKKLD